MQIPKLALAGLINISTVIITLCPPSQVSAQQAHPTQAGHETIVTLANLSEMEREALIAQVTEIANQTANEKSWFEQDLRPLSIKATLNIESNSIVFDMEGRLSHEAGFDDMSDLHRTIENRILMLENAREINVFDWTYGGRSLDDILSDIGPGSAHVSQAENAKAAMPSIIVETGFHTNASDAELIKDAEFRRISMMGVAKAYKLFEEGRECEEFEIANMEDLTEVVDKEAQMPVVLKGNPIYPLRIRYLPSRCYREPCTADSQSINSVRELERFRIRRYCRRDDVEKGPVEYTVSVSDFWGALTEPKVFRLTCIPRASKRS